MMVSILALASSLAQSTTAPPLQQPPTPSTVEQSEAARLGVSTTVDLEGSVGYSSNPQLRFNSSGQGFGRLSIYVAHARQSERSATVLSVYGENTTYTGGAGSQQLLRATASHQVAVTEKMRVFGDLNATLDKGGQLGNRLFGAPNASIAVVPDAIPTFPGTSDELVLIGGSTYRLGGQAGVQFSLSQRDSITLRSGAEYVMFRGLQSDNDFTSLFASAGWDRQLTERATAGLQLDVRHTDYSRGRSARSITPQVTGRLEIAERVELRGAAGISFAENDDGIDTQRSVGLTFNGSICGRSEAQTYCARVARDQQANSIAGPSTSHTFDLNYSRRIDQNQSIQLSAGASRQSQRFDTSLEGNPIGRQTYLRASGSYTRNIGPRWLAGVNVAARSLRRSGSDPKPDVSASVFVRWRVGDLR